MFFYQRIFRTGSLRIVNWVIRIINALVVVWGCGYFFSWLFGCQTNFSFLWGNQEELQCKVNLSMVDLSLSISDVIMDVLIFTFPIPLVGCHEVSPSYGADCIRF